MVSGLLGMAAKFAEVVLAIRYREQDDQGTYRGGAMYILKNGPRAPWLGSVFALLTAVAAFGTPNGLMALPNLAALLVLSPVVARALRDFAERERAPS